jgi:plastocyanin
MRRRDVLAGVGAVATAGLAGCGGVLGSGSGCGGGEFDVGMAASAYEPPTVTVEVGDTVVWKNTSQRAHTVTAYGSQLPDGTEFWASGGFDDTTAARDGWKAGQTGAIFTCETYEHTFETAGEHPYFCIPHERGNMVGTVVVEG